MRPQINFGVITVILLVSILEGQSTAIFETESVRGQIRDSRWNWNSHIDYSNEEFAGDSAKKILINEVTDFKRDKRQIQNNISGEKGGEMTQEEQLLVEDPKGWGLAHVLGIVSLVCLVIYIIGITYKLIKMHMGTYVREDPVFLKYK